MLLNALVRMFTLAPKAPEPLVDVPAPRCTCTSASEATRSGVFTQKMLWLSGSFIGMSLVVMLMRVASVPRTRSEV